MLGIQYVVTFRPLNFNENFLLEATMLKVKK